MALINCNECKKQISDTATSCPHCGAPTPQKNTKKVSILLGTGIFLIPIIFSWATLRGGYSKTVQAISLSWMGLFIIISLATPDTNKAATTPATKTTTIEQKEAAEPQKTAEQLAKEEAECKKSRDCWGRKHAGLALYCTKHIEKLAQYDYEWTDSWLETKFDRFGWANQENLILT
jgi:RNA polymerase subunit RPABC4/transcription elongation factor Spt4